MERALEAALTHNATSVSLWLFLASVHDLHQKYAEAEKIYEKVVELDSRNYRALNNLAWMISTRDGDLSRAFAYVQRAFELAGPMAQLRDTRAMIYFKQGNTRAALEDLEAALDDEPNPERYFHLALVQEKSNNRLAAKLTLNKAREMRLNHQLLHPLERARYHQLLAALDVR